jgi:hypothetical protein
MKIHPPGGENPSGNSIAPQKKNSSCGFFSKVRPPHGKISKSAPSQGQADALYANQMKKIAHIFSYSAPSLNLYGEKSVAHWVNLQLEWLLSF